MECCSAQANVTSWARLFHGDGAARSMTALLCWEASERRGFYYLILTSLRLIPGSAVPAVHRGILSMMLRTRKYGVLKIRSESL